jgi:hypothetical protein
MSNGAAHKATTHPTCMTPLLNTLDGSRQERRCHGEGDGDFHRVESLFVFFLIVVFFLLGEVAVFGDFLFLVFVVFVIIQIFGDDIQVDGMDLRNFQFGLALWATQNLAFFDLVFVNVDFGGTFRAADHDPSSVRDSKCRRR